MRKRLLLLAAATLVAGLGWYAPRPTQSGALVTVGKSSFSVAVAANAVEQQHGLRGRRSLAADQGMLFPFPGDPVAPVFTMDGVRFPLDLLWIVDDRVVGFTLDVPPAAADAGTRYPPPRPVTAVLELPGGTVRRLGLQAGDLVIVSPRRSR